MGTLKNWINKRRSAEDFVRLYGDRLPESESARVRQTCESSTVYQQQFQGAMRVMAGIEALANDPQIMAAASAPLQESTWDKTRECWPRLAAAAVLVLAVGLLFQQFADFSSDAPGKVSLYITGLGEQKTLTLADGSQVSLNTNSQLLVNYSEQSRRLILEHGEAYFDVAADASRPFTVELGARSVSALGTQFNIQRSPEKFALAVVEGTVAIHRQGEQAQATAPELIAPEGEPVQLKTASQRRVEAGMVAEFDIEQQTLTAYQASNIDRYSSWRSGVVRFEYEPLYKVVQELNRYMPKKILIEDEMVMNLKIYATVRLDNLNAALMGLENTLPIKVIRHTDRTVIVGDQTRSVE